MFLLNNEKTNIPGEGKIELMQLFLCVSTKYVSSLTTHFHQTINLHLILHK